MKLQPRTSSATHSASSEVLVEEMETASRFSNVKSSGYTGRCAPLSPFTFLPASSLQSDYAHVESKGNLEGRNYHHRCLSESFPIEEQLSWLDDLLNEAEPVFQRGYRRAASDSFAFLGEAADAFTSRQESKFAFAKTGAAPERSQNLLHNEDLDRTFIQTNTSLKVDKHNQESEKVVSSLAVEHNRDEYSAEILEASQVKPAGLKTDQKRAKQHNGHQSRVRKLQYIAHLERNVEILKAEGDGILAELEFFEQQNMILTMENRALRHHRETISREQRIKHWEQGMLEKEIARLQSLHHLQKQQQMHQQQPYNQHQKHRRNRSADLDHQAKSLSNKNKDANASKVWINDSVQA